MIKVSRDILYYPSFWLLKLGFANIHHVDVWLIEILKIRLL